MSIRRQLKWYGATYQIWLDGALTKSHERGVMCPECQDGQLVEIGHTLWQLGFFSDLCWEMTICAKCETNVAVLSEIEHEEVVIIPKPNIKRKTATKTPKGGTP